MVTGEVPVPEWVVEPAVVLFWYGALEVMDQERVVVLFVDQGRVWVLCLDQE